MYCCLSAPKVGVNTLSTLSVTWLGEGVGEGCTKTGGGTVNCICMACSNGTIGTESEDCCSAIGVGARGEFNHKGGRFIISFDSIVGDAAAKLNVFDTLAGDMKEL